MKNLIDNNMLENLSMYQAVRKTAEENPNSLAIYYQGTKIKYSAFIKRVDRMADILTNVLDVKKNDVVLVAQPNIPEVLVLLYALNKIGAVVNLVHPFTPYNQIVNIMTKTGTKVAFVFEQRVAKEVEKYREISDRIFVTRVEDDLPFFQKLFYHVFMNFKIRRKLGFFSRRFKGFNYVKDLKPTGKGSPTTEGKKNETAILLHSGSTTGDPKTICLSDYSFNFLGEKCTEFIGKETKDLKAKGMLSILPSFHGFGVCMTMHGPLCIGLSVVLIPKYSAKAVSKAMNKTPIGVMCGVPTMYENLLKCKEFTANRHLKNMYIAWCGGDYIAPNTRDDFNKLMKEHGSNCHLFEGYGLTEAIAVNIINNFEHHKDGSIGYPVSGVDVKIMDENGNEVPRNQIGEIAIKGGANMIGYYNNPEATEQAVKDGYVYTGDLGYMDEDNFVFFKQRKKRVIKVSGVGVFPSEVENLVEHIQGVRNCCAIEIPDSRLQHAIKLFVVADYFDEEDMRDHIIKKCRKYLIRWSIPKEIEFVKELPKTLLGKVDFKTLQKQENERRGIKE